MTAPFLEIDNLVVKYGRDVTVGPISLSIGEGEFVSLLGPSGCGKTTTLRSIAGFTDHASGDVRVRQRSLMREPPHRRNVGLVFQNYALFPHLTVDENIAFGLKRHRYPRREIPARVDQMIQRMGLQSLGDRLPSALSGGQQQRVALGRSLVLDPDVLLLDEPLSNLDRELRVQLRKELRRTHREFRKTVIYVTHDQEEALSLSDRIAVMMRGQVAQYGRPEEIFERPATAEVADFMGECVIFSGTLRLYLPEAGSALVDGENGMRWRVPMAAHDFLAGQRVRVVVRADTVCPTAPADQGTPNVFQVLVRDRYYSGDKTMLTCMLADGRELPLSVDPHAAIAEQPSDSRLFCCVPDAKLNCFPVSP
jgi:putative spermidine/putrescine transport system ATP-binding protein